jgi:hypothetical protein
MLGFEPLCLSVQSVFFLSLKTLLKHVGFTVFLLNSARLLSARNFGRGFLVLESKSLCEYLIRDFFAPQKGILIVVWAGCMLDFGLLLLSAQSVIF